MVKMYVAKNPITSILMMPICLLSVAILMTIGLVFNRLKTIPSFASLFSSFADKASHVTHGVKIH
ncbi:hypothetical protein D3C86_1990020 [compost metagenome]